MTQTPIHRARRDIVLLLALLTASVSVVATGDRRARADAGDAVLDWNVDAVNALFNPTTATPFPGAGQALPGQLHLAMVQGAVYDAVNAIDGGHQPYLEGLPTAPSNASIDAAVATAAHDVLVGLTNPVTDAVLLPQVTRDWLSVEHAVSLANAVDGDVAAGVEIGAAVAAAMLNDRDDDGRFEPFSFTQGTGIGEWRDTGSGTDPFAWVARVDPFLVEAPSQFPTEGPSAVAGPAYAEEYEEVRALGSASSTSRTPEQTALARFYRENAIVLWNRTFRGISEDLGLDPVQEARLFGMLNLAGADAAIACWDDKARWSFWRPVTAIRLGEFDGNPATVGDPSWIAFGASPLVAGVNPPYPDHPSGYNCLTGAMMHVAWDFFGTNKVSFTVQSGLGLPSRDYTRFSDAFRDTIDARVYLGIHFRKADVAGVVLGKKVAAWADKHYFQTVDEG